MLGDDALSLTGNTVTYPASVWYGSSERKGTERRDGKQFDWFID